MLRFIALLFLIVAVALTTWLRTERDWKPRPLDLQVVALAVPPASVADPHLAPFRLEGVWQYASPKSRFGGFSALLAMRDGSLMALSDGGMFFRFRPPDDPVQRAPQFGQLFREPLELKEFFDVEAATTNPDQSLIWVARENGNSVTRLRTGKGQPVFAGKTRPPDMAHWGDNSGPESLVRLRDGRFVALREAFLSMTEDVRHDAVIFAGDPLEDPEVQRFTFAGPASFSPTDMAQLPDGRVLILMRRPVWPFPPRFAGRIAIGDPATIRQGKVWRVREVAKLTSSLPVDNFEGLAIVPRDDGEVTVWLISDDNLGVLQRTLLWKLAVDPADLP